GNDDHLRLSNMRRLMADKDASSQLFQPTGRIRRLQIGAADFVTEREEHLGNAAHAGAADPHQMDVLRLTKHRRAPQTSSRLWWCNAVALSCTIRVLTLQETG